MKIAVILGSPRQRDSYQLCKQIESRMTDAQFDYIHLSQLNIKPCIACDACFKKSEMICPCHDDLQGIRERLSRSNAIIFASPVYAYQVPSTLKKFIDRMSYVFHRQEFVGIPTLLLVSSEGGGHKQVTKYLNMVATGWGCDVVGQLSIIAPLYFDEKRVNSAWSYNTKYASKKSKALQQICDDLKESLLMKTKKIPSYKDIFMFNCLRSKTYTSQVDYDYWKEKGWLDSNYFYETKLSLCKNLFGKTIKLGIAIASKRIDNRIVE